jgi:hypothetical protein
VWLGATVENWISDHSKASLPEVKFELVSIHIVTQGVEVRFQSDHITGVGHADEQRPAMRIGKGRDGRNGGRRRTMLLRDDLESAGLTTQYKGIDLDTRVFRRSFATWLEANGVPGEHIDRLLGHAQQSVRGRHSLGRGPRRPARRSGDDPP